MSRGRPSRREFLGAAVALAAAGAGPRRGAPAPSSTAADDGRLRARPGRPAGAAQPGAQALGLAQGRDGMLFVPASYRPGQPAPFLLALHGATGSGRAALAGWQPLADAHGLVVLAPDSREGTWDGARGGFGPDVTFIDRALAQVFAKCAVDPRRTTVSGFSDGASYALSLGLVNGDLFRKVVAFSPGFIVPGEWRGEPEFFVSHGRADPILPIDMAGRRIVTMLQRGGYRVRYREFDGGHTVPPEIRQEAVEWVLGS